MTKTPNRHTSLADRLLGLTVLVVLIAQVIFFLPLASNFRQGWLMDRVQAARLVVLGVESARDMMVSEEVGAQMLETAGILAVRINRGGTSEIILPAPMEPGDNKLLDMRKANFFTLLWEAMDSLLIKQPEYLRLVDDLGEQEGDLIEVLVRSGDLRHALNQFSARTFWYSMAMSMWVGAMLYMALAWLVVQPMVRLKKDMESFRENPEDPTRVMQPGDRTDEIGEAETELARLQQEVHGALRQKTRLAALGEAVAKINHDLRNILASAQLVSDRLATSEEPRTRSMGERLVRSIDRGVALCQSVLDFGRPVEPEANLLTLNLYLALEDAWMDVGADTSGIEWINHVDTKTSVRADAESLYRIFLNLMRNAAQAMQGSGSITVRAETHDNLVELALIDTGPGIPDKVLQNLFAPFAGRGSKKGTGLGLAIARDLSRGMGGDLVLLQTSEAGTTFVVKLPSI